jgi:coenzyme F420-dependent glucose-6-phosphate dehydrogenase
MSLRIGFKASAEQFTARYLIDTTVEAEQAGFDSAFISDHFQPWRHTGGHAPYSLAWLAAAGERTSRLVLGTSVMTPHYRYNPAVIAQAFATLGSLYPGRVILGVGSGEALNEIATGWRGAGTAEWPDFRERFARLRESVDLIGQLWRGERVSFRGDYYETVEASIYDRPEHPVPIYIAAAGPVVATYAGRAAQGFICTSGKGRDLYAERLLPALEAGLAETGRAPDDIDRMIEVKLSYDRDPAAALENTRFWAPLSLTPEQKHSLTDPVEMERAADALPIAEVARRWIVASDPEDAVARIREYVDLGFNHLVFHAPGADQHRFLEQFAEDVLPELRRLA